MAVPVAVVTRVRKVLPHTCCYCGKTHTRGAKSFDVAGTRCVKREGCTYKALPKATRPKPRGVCFVCHGSIVLGTARCANHDTCHRRAIGGMRVLRIYDGTIRQWYRQALPPAAPDVPELERIAA